ncbi:hypothetical protein Tco_0095452, partial [Tanacetum coccineum]
DGASWSTVVEEGESVDAAGSEATTSAIGAMTLEAGRSTLDGGLKFLLKFEEIQVLYEKIKRSDEDFISIGSAEDERLIKKMNEKGIDSSKNEMVNEESKEEVKEESKEEVKEESKEEESNRKRKLGTRKK